MKFLTRLIFICLSIHTAPALAQTDFWEPAGTSTLDVEALTIAPNGDVYAATFNTGVYRSTDNGDTWTGVNTGLTNPFGRAIIADASGRVFVGTDFGGVFRSADDGASWVEVNSGLDNLGLNILAVNDAGDLFAGTQGGLFRSSDGGDSWSLVFEGSGSQIVALAFDRSTGRTFASGLLAYSDDNAASWTFIPVPGGGTGTVQALGVSDNGTVFASKVPGGVWRSTDGGATWSPADSGIPAFTETRAFAVAGATVYAAIQQFGVMVTTNGGDLWSPVSSGLPIGPVLGRTQTLVMNSRGDLFLATSQGVYRHLVPSTGAEDEGELPRAVSLEQNYPNPFNPSTTMVFELPVASRVSLAIFDALGRLVAQPVAGLQPAGRHQVAFDASGLPCGVYVYRLEASGVARTRRMVVVR